MKRKDSKTYAHWPRQQFERVTEIHGSRAIGLLHGRVFAIVVLPSKRLHDSGFRMVSYVFFDEQGEVLGRSPAVSDHLMLKGPGVFSFDWLPGSGLIRFVAMERFGRLVCDQYFLSTFEVKIEDTRRAIQLREPT